MNKLELEVLRKRLAQRKSLRFPLWLDVVVKLICLFGACKTVYDGDLAVGGMTSVYSLFFILNYITLFFFTRYSKGDDQELELLIRLAEDMDSRINKEVCGSIKD
jgi:hypothetical protein